MKRTFQLLCLGVFLSLCLAQMTQPEEGEGGDEVVDLFTTPSTKIAAAISDFGYNLFRQLASQDPTTNVFLSPVSVSVALTQLSLEPVNVFWLGLDSISEEPVSTLHRQLTSQSALHTDWLALNLPERSSGTGRVTKRLEMEKWLKRKSCCAGARASDADYSLLTNVVLLSVPLLASQ